MGIEKLSWADCKDMIKAVNKPFYELLADYPGIDSYTFEKYSYTYGQIICDEKYFYTPDGEKVSENIPFSIFLNKTFEMYINFENKVITEFTLNPGDLIFIASFLSKNYCKNAFSDICLCAGTRSPILIGNIGNTAKYHEVSNYLNHDIVQYASSEDNFYLLKEICKAYNSNWRAEFLVFPMQLHKKINENKDVCSLLILNYINNYFLDRESFAISYKYYNLIISYIKRYYSTMMNSSYINDIIKDIYNMGCGYKSSYKLACDNDSLPLDDLHHIFNEVYKTDIAPFIMVPSMFSREKDCSHYFSIPVHTITYKPEKVINLTELSLKLKKLFSIYRESIDKLNFSDHTTFYQVSQNLELKIVTDRVSMASKQQVVTLLKDITTIDESFKQQLLMFKNQGYDVVMPQRSKFFSGAFLLDYQALY
ncbi:hypothetical protein L3V86_03540 [Thiotrichales bacterium 19S11-10]|nr:hypothetical protein [Thiotrichales bacterium 19S11-10]